jgi:hypothetical protein
MSCLRDGASAGEYPRRRRTDPTGDAVGDSDQGGASFAAGEADVVATPKLPAARADGVLEFSAEDSPEHW